MEKTNIKNAKNFGGGNRSSSIELLKIIAIIFIVISHAMQDNVTGSLKEIIDINCATTNVQYFIVALLHNLGQIGNVIFIISSAWFLVDSSKVKPNKIIGMVTSCFVISVLFLILGILMGYEFPLTYMIRNLMPVTFSCNWFVTCYLLLYLVHPLLNIIIRNLTQRELLQVNIGFGILYFGLGFLMKNSLFYFSNIIGFIGIYFLVAYVKLYLKSLISNTRKQCLFLLFGTIGWLALMICTNVIGLRIEMFSDWMMRWNTFMNPFFVLIGFSMFNIFKRFELKSNFVNYVSGLSLLIYIIHCNRVIRDYVRYDIFEYIYERYTFENIVLWVFVYAFISFVLAYVLAVLYKVVIEKGVTKIGESIYNFSKRYVGRMILLIEKME